MTDEALPQAHQPATLVFGADFGADPLWHRSPTGQMHMANLDRLPLSASLKAELRTWARRHDKLQDPPNPVRGTEEDVAAWLAHGESLLTALREELGPDYDVVARSDLPRPPVLSPAEESARQLPARSQRPGIVDAFTVDEHHALGQQIAPMCQELLWTVGDLTRRYGRQDPLTEQAIRAQRAVHELRTLLEAELAQAHPDHFEERPYYPRGPDRGPYDRPR